ncbi:unnamed protein product [Boreogadus saida]
MTAFSGHTDLTSVVMQNPDWQGATPPSTNRKAVRVQSGESGTVMRRPRERPQTELRRGDREKVLRALCEEDEETGRRSSELREMRRRPREGPQSSV